MAKPLRKKEREVCWEMRDDYYKCLDQHLSPNLRINKEKKILETKEDQATLLAKCKIVQERYVLIRVHFFI
jgi:hypothetical protein